MNRAQRTLLIFYPLVVALLCLWVPWRVAFNSGNGVRYLFNGYDWLWTGNSSDAYLSHFRSSSPAYGVVLLELVAATALFATVFGIVRWWTFVTGGMRRIARIRFDGKWYVRLFKVCIAVVGGFILAALLSVIPAVTHGFLSAFRTN